MRRLPWMRSFFFRESRNCHMRKESLSKCWLSFWNMILLSRSACLFSVFDFLYLFAWDWARNERFGCVCVCLCVNVCVCLCKSASREMCVLKVCVRIAFQESQIGGKYVSRRICIQDRTHNITHCDADSPASVSKILWKCCLSFFRLYSYLLNLGS